jgi:sugar phosphate isomerase/epimerase
MMTRDLPGGVGYHLPTEELEAIAQLLVRGREWAACNGIALNERISRRIEDLQAVAAALKRANAVAPATSPSSQPLHAVKVDDMGEVVVISPAAAAGALGCSRQRVNRRLIDGSLAGSKDPRGYWRIPLEAIEAELAKRGA